MVKPFSLLDDDSPKKRRKKSGKQEAKTAKELGGKVQPGSGALWGAKGDVKTETFLIENKYTGKGKKSFSITSKLWEEIKKKAILFEGKNPALQIDLEEGKHRILVMDYQDFLELVERAGEGWK